MQFLSYIFQGNDEQVQKIPFSTHDQSFLHYNLSTESLRITKRGYSSSKMRVFLDLIKHCQYELG